ncbi:MAG: nitrogenase cofactor biosynthesis protein NifB [Methanobacteriota archaeon]|nr:MAG: nitrogenase cofactor biosynthesis protein NifB [Euryarchaeota archaeon]
MSEGTPQEDSSHTLPDWASNHPCYNHQASCKFARIHLPVAPNCNIQCKYCNRKFDCPNENRPGVASEILSPLDAVRRVRFARNKIENLSVVGIAGPGEPLANEETFETLKMVRRIHPDLHLCLATNGLLAPVYIDRLNELGLEFATVSIAAMDPYVGKKIYDWVRWNGNVFKGEFAFKVLSQNQWQAVELFVNSGILVKINTVFIPGVNDDQIGKIAKKAADMGAHMLNVMPLIPVEGSGFEGHRSPTNKEVKLVRDYCETSIPQMRHCAKCKADAVGLLGEDISFCL